MSQYVVYTILSYLMLVPIAAVLWSSTKPTRLRAPRVTVDPRTVTTDSDHWGLI